MLHELQRGMLAIVVSELCSGTLCVSVDSVTSVGARVREASLQSCHSMFLLHRVSTILHNNLAQLKTSETSPLWTIHFHLVCSACFGAAVRDVYNLVKGTPIKEIIITSDNLESFDPVKSIEDALGEKSDDVTINDCLSLFNESVTIKSPLLHELVITKMRLDSELKIHTDKCLELVDVASHICRRRITINDKKVDRSFGLENWNIRTSSHFTLKCTMSNELKVL